MPLSYYHSASFKSGWHPRVKPRLYSVGCTSHHVIVALFMQEDVVSWILPQGLLTSEQYIKLQKNSSVDGKCQK